MNYRILSDDAKHLCLLFDNIEVIEKIGKGHLFSPEKAAGVLKPLIKDFELLPVMYGDGLKGFIFNPLKIVAADPKQRTKNQ